MLLETEYLLRKMQDTKDTKNKEAHKKGGAKQLIIGRALNPTNKTHRKSHKDLIIELQTNIKPNKEQNIDKIHLFPLNDSIVSLTAKTPQN